MNPVLREGNSDRRAPDSVKSFVRAHPHSMGEWSSDSKTHVATMADGDFRSTEKSVTVAAEDDVRIEHVAEDGTVTVLKESTPLLAGEVIDAAVMRREALEAFLAEQLDDARESGVLFSVHLKATMMKVSDPIIFGHAVGAMFGELFEKRAGINPDDGLAALASADDEAQAEIDAVLAEGPEPLHGRLRPGRDQPARAQRRDHRRLDAGADPLRRQGLGRRGRPAGHQVRDPRQLVRGALPGDDRPLPRARGVRPGDDGHDPQRRPDGAEGRGVRLARQDLRDRGPGHGARGRPGAGRPLLEHEVDTGDIWRMCQTKDAPIQDWVRLAVSARAGHGRARGVLARRDARPRRRSCWRRCARRSRRSTPRAPQIEILPVAEATRFTLERARAGEDTISVTGNVLRDYLTDLFPILELGTSAKMLSIVPLMGGGGLFETGAGGSAPKHVQQFVKENHLRWDSLGEFLALAVSLEFLADKTDNPRAGVLGATLDRATGKLLEEGRSPLAQGRGAGQPGQPRLPGRLLGGRAGRADRRRRPGGGGRAAGGAAGGRRGDRSSRS